MTYLTLTILLSTAFSLMIKHAHARNYGVLAVGCLNYIVAGVIGIVWAALVRTEPLSWAAFGFGCLGGTMYVLCYLAIMVMLDRQGISVATAMTRLAIAIPIGVSIVVWHERPTWVQTVGLLLTFAAISAFDLRGIGRVTGSRWDRFWPLAACFLTAGCSRLSQKAFGHFCSEAQRPVYIASWFGFAGLIALVMLTARRIRPRGGDWPFGTALGLVNIGTLFCIINALQRVPAIVFFPVTAVGSLVMVVVFAAWLWGEHLDVRTRWGVALACAALVLVNLRGADSSTGKAAQKVGIKIGVWQNH